MKNVINKIVQLATKKAPQVPPQTTTSIKNNDNVEYLDPAVAFFMSVGKKYGHNFSVDQVETYRDEDIAKMPFEKDNPFLNRRIIFHRNTRK